MKAIASQFQYIGCELAWLQQTESGVLHTVPWTRDFWIGLAQTNLAWRTNRFRRDSREASISGRWLVDLTDLPLLPRARGH